MGKRVEPARTPHDGGRPKIERKNTRNYGIYPDTDGNPPRRGSHGRKNGRLHSERPRANNVAYAKPGNGQINGIFAVWAKRCV